ncbi:MAG TPA: DUF1648 domain-containing protein [Terracidiphilus sp.]|jgi:uncharacterized membrane protein|nr:DUF1648 domain-containing protein [Terracidiphilus sp.]
MRKALEIVSLLALAVLVFITVRAFFGPARLPGRIPTHFNAAGQPDGYGSPAMLLVFPAIAVALYLLMSLVARFPAAFNFPVRVTPFNRQRLEDLALNMIAWLKAEIVVFFTWIEAGVIRAVRQPGHGLSPALMPALLGAVFATCIVYIAVMFKAGRSASRR